MTTENCVKTGTVSVNGIEIVYKVCTAATATVPYLFKMFRGFKYIGHLLMTAEDYESFDLIYLEETIYSFAQDGILPEVKKVCNIPDYSSQEAE